MFPGLSPSRYHTASNKSPGDKPGNEAKTDRHTQMEKSGYEIRHDPEMARDTVDCAQVI